MSNFTGVDQVLHNALKTNREDMYYYHWGVPGKSQRHQSVLSPTSPPMPAGNSSFTKSFIRGQPTNVPGTNGPLNGIWTSQAPVWVAAGVGALMLYVVASNLM